MGTPVVPAFREMIDRYQARRGNRHISGMELIAGATHDDLAIVEMLMEGIALVIVFPARVRCRHGKAPCYLEPGNLMQRPVKDFHSGPDVKVQQISIAAKRDFVSVARICVRKDAHEFFPGSSQ